MCPKLNSVILCLVSFLVLSSCKNEQRKDSLWIETKEGVLVYVTPFSGNCSYSWQGPTFENVANGKGRLLVFDSTGNVSSEQVEAYYGAIDRELIKATKGGGKYVGTLDADKNLSGFGVLIENEDLFVGNFVQGKPEGQLKQYKDGKLYYDGFWKQGKFEGEGIWYKQDDSVSSGVWENNKLVSTKVDVELPIGRYVGYIVDDKPSLQGTMFYHNGGKYEGEWNEGLWSGKGYYVSLKDSINGEWESGKLNGNAFVSTQDFSYDGEWVDNTPDGFGTIIFSDSSFYDGSWESGHRNGYGGFVSSSGDKYFGDWENDVFSGLGSYEFSNGDYYEGEWKEGLQNGEGKYVSEQFTYVGNWEEGWMNGNGLIQFQNGDIYEGNFVENERYGEGVYQFANGNVYEGEFVDNRFHGLGRFSFNDGSVYEGEFFEGKIDGDGTLVLVMEDDTLAITANWDGSDQFPKYASILFSNGDLYEGEIVGGQPTNNGIWTNVQEEEESGFVKAVKKANEYYNTHRKTINKAVIVTSVALTVVAVAATGGAALSAAPEVAEVLKIISSVATKANDVINYVDAGTSIVSAGIDGDWATAATEVAINAAFIAIPHVSAKVAPLLKKPARKLGVLLSGAARTALKPMRTSIVKISQSKAFKKIVSVTKKDGVLQKTVSKASKKEVREIAEKPAKKFDSKYLKRLMNKSHINKRLEAILAKGPIKLTKKEMELLKKEPWQLNEIMKKYVGNEKNFQEFFIRLSKGDMNQTKLLLDDKAIWNNVRDKIRPGDYHEWLMTSNFRDFLTNPKWGNDGPYLCMALTEFIQRTDNVLFKTGWGHVSAGMSSKAARKASAAFHNGLSQVISQCSSKEELFSAIRKYAKEQLKEESYQEFEQILISVLS